MEAKNCPTAHDDFKKVEDSAPAQWVIEMREYYARTGSYRPADLRRLLGDQSEGVQAGPAGALSQYLSRT